MAKLDEYTQRATGSVTDTEDEPIIPEVMPPTALEAITRAEVDMLVTTAKRNPRSLTKFKKEALSMVTIDPLTAKSCYYVLERKGKDPETGEFITKKIEGESIRMAEICINCWMNCSWAGRVIDINNKFVVAQSVCIDYEKNNRISVEIRRRITGKDGRLFSDDMIGVTANAAISIAMRDSAFRVIPKALTKELFDAAKKTAAGDARTLKARREQAVAHFAAIGVGLDRLLFKLGKQGIDDIDLIDIETLLGIHTAITDNLTTAEQSFPPVPKPKLDEELAKQKAKKKSSPKKRVKETKPKEEPPKE